jgi:hypothetical protein
MNQFFAKIVASILDRALKNKVTTAVGILVGVAGSIAAFTPVIPTSYHALAAGVASLCGAVALVLAKDGGVAPPQP